MRFLQAAVIVVFASGTSMCDQTIPAGLLLLAKTGFFSSKSLAVVEDVAGQDKYRLTTLHKKSVFSRMFSIESDLAEAKDTRELHCSALFPFNLDATLIKAREDAKQAAANDDKSHIPTLIAASTRKEQLEIEYAQYVARFGVQSNDPDGTILDGAKTRLQILKQKANLGEMTVFDVGEVISFSYEHYVEQTGIVLSHTENKDDPSKPGTLKVAVMSQRGLVHHLRSGLNAFTSLFGMKISNTHPVIDIPATQDNVVSRNPTMSRDQVNTAVHYAQAVVQLYEAAKTSSCPSAPAILPQSRAMVVGIQGKGQRRYTTCEGIVTSALGGRVQILLDVQDVKARLAKIVAATAVGVGSGYYLWRGISWKRSAANAVAKTVAGEKGIRALNLDNTLAAGVFGASLKSVVTTTGELVMNFLDHEAAKWTGRCSPIGTLEADSAKVFCVVVPKCNVVVTKEPPVSAQPPANSPGPTTGRFWGFGKMTST